MEKFQRNINIPKVSENKAKFCEEDLTKKNLYNSLKSMQNDKSPGNKRLTKVYKTALNELRKIFLDFVSEAEKRTFKFISETAYRNK